MWVSRLVRPHQKLNISESQALTDQKLTVEPGIHLKAGYALAVGIQLGAFITLDRPRCHGRRK